MMDGLTIYETAWGDFDAAIEISKTPEQMETAKKISDFIRALPLTTEQNNALVSLLLEYTDATAKGAFAQGVAFTLKLERDAPDGQGGDELPQ